MGKRKLSFLQKAYRAFFLNMLKEFSVGSQAELSYDRKKDFFNRIKLEWPAQRAKLLKENKAKKKKPEPKKRSYAKLTVSRPTVALEPKESFGNTINIRSESITETIISERNPNQSDDLRINFFPNAFFEQVETYKYPIVKMPNAESFLKLPRKGRAMGKGYKEDDFFKALKTTLVGIEVANDFHMVIPHFSRPYEPDIVLIDESLRLYVDIEIDEPYDGYYRFPSHEIEKDDTRDLFFTESGWVVIRFTEKQVHEQEKECIAYVKDVLNSISHFRFEETSNCKSEKQWDYQQAIRWEKSHYREKYLGIDGFGKQVSRTEVLIDINEQEGIEAALERTKKRKAENHQDNIAFEDEAHVYHHSQDETGNAEYISVTTLIDRFFPFDLERFIQGKAKKEGLSEEEVFEEFEKNREEAAKKGTFLHEQIERFLKGEAYDDSTKEFDLFKQFYREVIVNKGFEFVEAEKRILLDKYNVAGTVDALFKKANSEDYVIMDWKRSKKLVIDGHPRKFGYGYALSELSELDNSSYYKYALQQKCYQKI